MIQGYFFSLLSQSELFDSTGSCLKMAAGESCDRLCFYKRRSLPSECKPALSTDSALAGFCFLGIKV